MALESSCDGELSGSLSTSQAADPSDEPNELCDQIFYELTSNISACQYVDTIDGNVFTNEIDSLILMHLNIPSLNKNINDLHIFISTLPFKPDVISLSEARVDQPLQNIDIEGYNLVHVKPKYGQAGGVAVYTTVRLCFAQMNSFPLHGSESIWLKVQHQNDSKTFVIGTIYRHPQESVDLFVDFSQCLEKLTNDNSTFYILGDINININKGAFESSQAKNYTNATTSSGAISVVTLPTRVTNNSSTVIDHIITNDLNHHVTPRVIRSSMTNHYVVACKISKFKASRKQVASPLYRDKSKFNNNVYNEDLFGKLESLFRINFPLNCDNFDLVFDQFVEIISTTINKHAPQKRMSRKQARLAMKPWITKGILLSIRKKNSMFKTHFISGNSIQKLFFRKYTNKLTKIKALSKQMYFHPELDKNKKNSRETWKIIRSVLPSKSSREAPSCVRLNNMTTSEDPTTVVNKFNNFFCTVGQNLAEKIEQVPNKRPEDFFDKKVISSCYLDPPTLTEVFDRIMALKDKAVGHDNVPSFF